MCVVKFICSFIFSNCFILVRVKVKSNPWNTGHKAGEFTPIYCRLAFTYSIRHTFIPIGNLTKPVYPSLCPTMVKWIKINKHSQSAYLQRFGHWEDTEEHRANPCNPLIIRAIVSSNLFYMLSHYINITFNQYQNIHL